MDENSSVENAMDENAMDENSTLPGILLLLHLKT